jgi:multidrug efflux system outer membrane protein
LLRGAAAARMPQIGGGGGASQRTGPLINEAGQGGRLINSAASLSYEIDMLGRLSKAKKAARLDAAASADLLRHARLLVEADTVQTYFEICALDEERSILVRAADDRRSTLKILEERESHGLATRLAVNRARAEVATLDSDLEDLDRRRAELVGGLALLIGEAPSELAIRAGSARRRSSRPIFQASSSPGGPTSRPGCAASRPPRRGSERRRRRGCRASA